jgi:hypothetical protein
MKEGRICLEMITTTTDLIKGTITDTTTKKITAKKITAIIVVVIVTEIHGYIECNKDTITTETKKIVR